MHEDSGLSRNVSFSDDTTRIVSCLSTNLFHLAMIILFAAIISSVILGVFVLPMKRNMDMQTEALVNIASELKHLRELPEKYAEEKEANVSKSDYSYYGGDVGVYAMPIENYYTPMTPDVQKSYASSLIKIGKELEKMNGIMQKWKR